MYEKRRAFFIIGLVFTCVFGANLAAALTATDITFRVNNWYKVKSSKITLIAMNAFFCGAGLMALIVFFVLRVKTIENKTTKEE